MGKSVDELMALRFGGATIAENIDRAVTEGRLVSRDDGALSLPSTGPSPLQAYIHNAPAPSCGFLRGVLFEAVYGRGAVPHGCRACYKVKVMPRTLRELVAAWVVARRQPFSSKWGLDVRNPHSQAIYAGLYYLNGLDEARVAYWAARDAYDKEPKLGSDVPIDIKRGCSEYEYVLGPSDTYTFTADQADIEHYIKGRFRNDTKVSASHPLSPLPSWIDFAFRIGDDTYLDFTGGRRFKPKTLRYDPGEPPRAG